MDILAGMLAYLAGLGALFGVVAVALVVFGAAPKEPSQTQSQPQSASAMLMRPSTPKKPGTLEARSKEVAKEGRGQSERHGAALPGAAQPTVSRGPHRKASTAQARRLMQEERARRWAHQQDSNFEKRFLGYAE